MLYFIFQVIQEIKLDPKFDPFLAQILICELCFGKKTLSGNSKPILTILENQQKIELYLNLLGNQKNSNNIKPKNPRYVRINTNKITHKKAMKMLSKDFIQVKYDEENLDYPKFMDLVKNLEENQFLVDLHIENLLIFHPKVSFNVHRVASELHFPML